VHAPVKARICLKRVFGTACHVRRVIIANPLQVRAIAHAKVKTDKIDAIVLATLHAAGFLPEVWQPDGATEAHEHDVSRRRRASAGSAQFLGRRDLRGRDPVDRHRRAPELRHFPETHRGRPRGWARAVVLRRSMLLLAPAARSSAPPPLKKIASAARETKRGPEGTPLYRRQELCLGRLSRLMLTHLAVWFFFGYIIHMFVKPRPPIQKKAPRILGDELGKHRKGRGSAGYAECEEHEQVAEDLVRHTDLFEDREQDDEGEESARVRGRDLRRQRQGR
jgi:hypothetical protein